MIKVALRSRSISGGRLSWYLDFWPPLPFPNGKVVRWETMKLYTWERARTTTEKAHNRETQSLAETIRSRRQIEVQNQAYGIGRDGDQVPAGEYIAELIKTKQPSTKLTWGCMLVHFKKEKAYNVALAKIEVSHCMQFRSALIKMVEKQEIQANTAHSYFSYFSAAIRTAYKTGLISQNLIDRVDTIKASEAKREYLLLDELNALAAIKPRYDVVWTIAMFAALSGLRISDIRKLEWKNVTEKDDGNAQLDYIMTKTKKEHRLPIGAQARALMGNRPEVEGVVWPYIPSQAQLCRLLREWTESAGITKHITMHCFRHTYATLQLAAGTDLKTLCDLLGQADIKTTQIYAKVLDESKAKAANRVVVNL